MLSTILALVLASGGAHGQQVFTDQIAGSGLVAQQANALALYDHDNDGFTDVIWGSNNFAQVQLMRNNGDLTFTDISATAGFQYLGAALQTLISTTTAGTISSKPTGRITASTCG
ncbi:MAG: VCBS repeat-containing protein [Flavobacteriales bacterium]|nr:VCBS repeat-containing protein [Flavobacteriales bacterium]